MREGIFLDRKLIPAFELSKRPINAYLLDYSRNPHYKSMLKYNKVSTLSLADTLSLTHTHSLSLTLTHTHSLSLLDYSRNPHYKSMLKYNKVSTPNPKP